MVRTGKNIECTEAMGIATEQIYATRILQMASVSIAWRDHDIRMQIVVDSHSIDKKSMNVLDSESVDNSSESEVWISDTVQTRSQIESVTRTR